MEIDLSQYGLSGAISHKLKTGLPTTAGNVTLNFDDSLDRLFAPRTTNAFNLEVSAPAMKGWLNGRRPAYGQQYPRGEHVAALDRTL